MKIEFLKLKILVETHVFLQITVKSLFSYLAQKKTKQKKTIIRKILKFNISSISLKECE